MSTGGNVPAQGVAIETIVEQKKQGDRGKLGKGTPGSRLKSLWKKSKCGESLRSFVKALAKNGVKAATGDGEKPGEDAKEWLITKSGGTVEQKSERKRRRKERKADNLSAKLSKKKPQKKS